MKRESFWGEGGAEFLDLVKAAILIVIFAKWGIPMAERAWEMRADILDIVWKVYGL
jgi:hypothetical protein